MMEGPQEEIVVRPGDAPGAFAVEGELCGANAEAFAKHVETLSGDAPQVITLDLWDLDILDGVGLAAMVNVIRALRESGHRVRLVGAPQLLGHNLYRIGLLRGENPVELVDMREEEPYG